MTRDNVGQVRPLRKDAASLTAYQDITPKPDEGFVTIGVLVLRAIATAWAKTSPEVKAAVMADPETWPTLREHLARAEALR